MESEKAVGSEGLEPQHEINTDEVPAPNHDPVYEQEESSKLS